MTLECHFHICNFSSIWIRSQIYFPDEKSDLIRLWQSLSRFTLTRSYASEMFRFFVSVVFLPCNGRKSLKVTSFLGAYQCSGEKGAFVLSPDPVMLVHCIVSRVIISLLLILWQHTLKNVSLSAPNNGSNSIPISQDFHHNGVDICDVIFQYPDDGRASWLRLRGCTIRRVDEASGGTHFWCCGTQQLNWEFLFRA